MEQIVTVVVSGGGIGGVVPGILICYCFFLSFNNDGF